MKFVGVRDFRTKSALIWKKLKNDRNVIVTSNGKPIAILTATSEDELEESLNAINQAQAREALNNIRFKIYEKQIPEITIDEIDDEISNYRRERKSK